ncbi:5022_t:CDS:2 [Cetraspora pellucida]|uniref:5022_t:CDS:1 n=1 Tax=Cetraspora pellucida TaxID=1433469 RepID=A0A9N9BIK0_9GLOM|nr:5022_t:CDS:2 [Cetraspora pellucida]
MYSSWFPILIYLTLIPLCTKSASYNPSGRTEFMSELVSDKIYYYGGFDDVVTRFNDFFYIDLTQPFFGSSPPYHFIKSLDTRTAASTVAHANKIYVFGGDYIIGADSKTPLVEFFQIQSLSTDPEISYTPDTFSTPSSRKWHASAIDHVNEKIYVWGGVKEIGTVMNFSSLSISQNDGTMYIYNIALSAWTSSPILTQPNGRCLHTATFVPDGRIIMIGGATSPDVGKTATKNGIIPSIIHHSATLLPSNKSIIIYGGSDQTGYSGLAVLNLSSYVWTVISPTGNAPSIISSGHDLPYFIFEYILGEYIFNNTRHLINPTIRILNISNNQYKWVDSYTPPPIVNQIQNSSTQNPSTQNPSTQNPGTDNPSTQTSNSSKIIIIGFAIGGIMCLGILVVCYILYKKRQMRHIVRIPGTSNELTNTRIK